MIRRLLIILNDKDYENTIDQGAHGFIGHYFMLWMLGRFGGLGSREGV